MTQYKDRVEAQRKKLEQEKLDNQVTSIDCRYANGKEVTEYNDKRRKDKIEWL